nr:hypothetical protein [Tanacetum cinerariifolium]
MALTFAETHNMVAFLTKSDVSEGFEKIIDFLNAHVIMYALMLPALIDRKKVIIIEDSIRQALRLDDADSVDCLPNKESFVELARMGSDNNVSFEEELVHQRLRKTLTHVLELSSCIYLDDRARGYRILTPLE